jgi:hypothetical protein
VHRLAAGHRIRFHARVEPGAGGAVLVEVPDHEGAWRQLMALPGDDAALALAVVR